MEEEDVLFVKIQLYDGLLGGVSIFRHFGFWEEMYKNGVSINLNFW